MNTEKNKKLDLITNTPLDIVDLVNTTIQSVLKKNTPPSNFIANWRESDLRDLIQDDFLVEMEQTDATKTNDK